MSARWTEEDLHRHTGKRVAEIAASEVPKRSKYRNVKVQVDGLSFDSKFEAQHYAELKLREKAGEISNLSVQVPFDLVTNDYGAAYPTHPVVCQYIADFVYFEGSDRVVEDTKGHLTALYRLKRKWMALSWGIIIREVYRT